MIIGRVPALPDHSKRTACSSEDRAAKQIEILQRIAGEARAAGHPLAIVERQLEDPAFHRGLLEKEARGREAYRMTTHHSETEQEMPLVGMAAVRAEIAAAIEARRSLAQVDLTAAISRTSTSPAWRAGDRCATGSKSGPTWF